MTKVLMVITAADRWTLKDGTVHPSGYWAEEVAFPHRAFTEAGWDITIATPGGKKPTLDRLSLGISGGMPGKRREIERYLDGIQDALATPVPLDAVDADSFDVVFYPGGHGPMEDLAYDETSGALLADRLASGKPLALLCHAPAAITAATGTDGKNPFAGRRMTGLSNREELLNRFAWKAPWLLEDKLKELGVDYSKALIPLRPHIVVDGNLYTGQNPQSSEELADRLITDVGAAWLLT
ncbi:type 1 glutamine amidotransferase domain-containing protein [Nocardia sp. NPDC060249]|uniref:type 1 glutamine amidotransferase domain-containing protein n=1 Tax=Nocardia sp. NPDC060249 TaxID=3347082 RepID=UPI003664341C